MQEESPLPHKRGTNGRLFCFQPNCGPLWPRGGSAHRRSAAVRARWWTFVETERARRRREGKEILAFHNDTDRRRKTEPSEQPQHDDAPRRRRKGGPRSEVGQALRAAYQQAVSEDIPPEMLDLLGKLG